MEQQNRLMDTVITGAIMIACFAIPFFILIPIEPLTKNPIISYMVYNNSNLLAKWVAIGVLAHILGSIVVVIVVCLIPRPYENEPARKFLRDKMPECMKLLEPSLENLYRKSSSWFYDKRSEPDSNEWIPDAATYKEVEDTIKKLDPDSIWAWIHYSDSRKELIDWGRRKLHYAYLAENWITAIVIGEFLGCLTALLYASPGIWRYAILVCFIVCSLYACLELWIMRKKNIDWDNDMVAIYVAARICRNLEDRFLPQLTREKEIQNKIRT
jgi:hypothetical protein